MSTKRDVTGTSSTTIGERSPRGIGYKRGHKECHHPLTGPRPGSRIPPGLAEHWAPTPSGQGSAAHSRNKGSGSHLNKRSTQLPSKAAEDALHNPTKGSGSNLDKRSTGLPSQSSQEHCNLWSDYSRGELTSLGRHPKVSGNGHPTYASAASLRRAHLEKKSNGRILDSVNQPAIWSPRTMPDHVTTARAAGEAFPRVES